MKIVLGSNSAARQKILADLGFEFEVMQANLDEKSIRSHVLHQIPVLLAKAKNSALAPMVEDGILITADTIIIHKDQIREKPADENELRHFLNTYWEAPAEVISAVCVTNTRTRKMIEAVESAKVFFHKFPDKLVEELVEHGALMSAAGGFIAEMPAIKKYIVHLEGNMDTVMGLPGALTQKLIKEVSE
jgi:septum formation protein